MPQDRFPSRKRLHQTRPQSAEAYRFRWQPAPKAADSTSATPAPTDSAARRRTSPAPEETLSPPLLRPRWVATPPPRRPGESLASVLVGANPKGAIRRISLAVRSSLDSLTATTEKPLVMVACSGGADSLALAVATIDLCSRRKIPVHTVTIDHGVREGSAAEAQRVADLCRQLGADEAEVVPLDEIAMRNARWLSGPEGGAREARHAALNRVGRVLKRARGLQVMTFYGHTMDDQAETVLLGLARGSGLRSLAGMSPVTMPDREEHPITVHPLLLIRRTDTVSACEALRLLPVDDPTNRANGPWRAADGSALRRAAVREFALPSLSSALGKDVAPNLTRTAQQLRRDNDCLDEIAAQVLEMVRCEPGISAYTRRPAKVDLDWEKLRGLHEGILTRVLRFAALEAGADAAALNSGHIDSMVTLVLHYTGQGALFLPGKIVAQRVRLDPPTEKGQPGLITPQPDAPIRLRFS
ncbi:tRNA lysidine(34) synthetase TilS [Boudabousia marimammalium]|uniref:tRNA(Ile)-lysidine synthase n=1 Tax=Boudabousia marimammalium TaxID=156892 RepID=A0A1Q5PMB9_9ACTO|nr:tRNA lysidine(34) synthetase TilS [Boudabousia marimammalium]OKL48691.1 tRNA lysidine(34) synthetase TilS [Boudabousia marimammalium]